MGMGRWVGPCSTLQGAPLTDLEAISRYFRACGDRAPKLKQPGSSSVPYPSTWARPRKVPSPPGQCLWPWNLPSSVLKRFTVPSAQPKRICDQRKKDQRKREEAARRDPGTLTRASALRSPASRCPGPSTGR